MVGVGGLGTFLRKDFSFIFFSLVEMHNPEPERLKAFWTAVQDVWLKLYGSSFPTAAAINVRILPVFTESAFNVPTGASTQYSDSRLL